jgi:UDP-2-acetamido-3-amino-2,3-dideoxy-glucuronate N-acetyltransferase
MSSPEVPRMIHLPTHRSDRGFLTVLEVEQLLPFQVARIYLIVDIPTSAIRGNHAHRRCHELLVAARGAFTVTLESPDATKLEYRLNAPSMSLYVPPLYWRRLDRFADDSECLVLASEPYDSSEYIRDYGEFRSYASSTGRH